MAFGFATTRSSVGLVRVDGLGTDSVIVTRDRLSIASDDDHPDVDPYAALAARVWLRMRRIGRAEGHQGHAVGVTWGEGADREAALLVEALMDAGFAKVTRVWAEDAVEELDRVSGPEKAAMGIDDPASPTTIPPDEAEMRLALGAAIASNRDATSPREHAQRALLRPQGPRWRVRDASSVAALALLVLLALSPGLRPTSGHVEQPDVSPTPAKLAVVPAPTAAPQEARQPPEGTLPAPAPVSTPVTAEVSSPAGADPEVPEQVPAVAPVAPAPQGPAPSTPLNGDDVAPPIVDPPPGPSDQLPAQSDCVLLCRVAI